MTDTDVQTRAEGVGDAFSAEAMLDVRKRTLRAMWDIAARIGAGTTEENAVAIAADVLREQGLRKGWHKIIVRCGANTIKNFHDASEPVVLGDNDIFFVDIGPLFEGIEGDAGAPFAVGDDPLMQQAAADVRELWKMVRDHWHHDGVTGVELYNFAERQASAMGWILNLDLTGHRLSDFPHKAHFGGKLSGAVFRPSSLRWVLEIQIRHPELDFGAFFEDLLLDDDDLQELVYKPPGA